MPPFRLGSPRSTQAPAPDDAPPLSVDIVAELTQWGK